MNSKDLTGRIDKETEQVIADAIGKDEGFSTDDLTEATSVKTKKVEPVVMRVTPRNNIGRNQPCPCGSKKKYKKCCLLKRTYTPGA